MIEAPLPTGVRAIDAMATIGAGQRMGIFAGPGVGKSTLLGQVVRHAEVEVSVIALVGERSREVREFIDDVLGPEGLANSVVVVATGEETPLRRFRAAKPRALPRVSSVGKKTLLVIILYCGPVCPAWPLVNRQRENYLRSFNIWPSWLNGPGGSWSTGLRGYHRPFYRAC